MRGTILRVGVDVGHLLPRQTFNGGILSVGVRVGVGVPVGVGVFVGVDVCDEVGVGVSVKVGV